MTEVSYLGYVYGTMVALARMRPRDRGTIVQCGSALGGRAIPLQSAYCGSKHAVNGFTESVRVELLHDKSNVKITIVQMSAVNTPQFSWVLSRLPEHPQPVPPIYQPEVAARGLVYAAEHPSRKQYWVGAVTVGTLLGQKLLLLCSIAIWRGRASPRSRPATRSTLIGLTISGLPLTVPMATTTAPTGSSTNAP